MIRASRFLGFGGPVVVTALILNAIAAHAFGPYTSGTTGYDVSYPQCSSSTLPSGSFGIVGVNDGRPFTSYACFGTRLYPYAAGSGSTPSVYINLGYSGAYRKKVTATCSNSGQSMAWQIGCSEADTSLGYVGGSAVAMWWLDVETANSWSSSNLSLNQQTIQGATDRLSQAGFQVGVYSTSSAWSTITGRTAVYTPNTTVATWVAGQNGLCPANGGKSFDANPMWLSQHTSGFDYDNAC